MGTAPFAAWAVVRLFGLERGWPLVPLVAFTPYAAALAPLPLAAALVLRAG
ncbi:MAG TPA: endonuclease/exonuclease/phosphatase family protein, partial [Rugosimonospora sp.]|nr:endonuclease/exonuclease/phosphatase family protein [Rugosimonospora sp.]